jgi:ribonuclease P protein component
MASIAVLTPPPHDAARPIIGVVCPKRWAKSAVTRNTFKRQIYAVTHELADQLPAACLVVRLAAGFSREEFKSATSPKLKHAVRQELFSLLSKISRRAAA